MSQGSVLMKDKSFVRLEVSIFKAGFVFPEPFIISSLNSKKDLVLDVTGFSNESPSSSDNVKSITSCIEVRLF
jgi:hypothetical protein